MNWLMVRVRSPSVFVVVAAYGFSLVVAAIIVVVLQMPSVGLTFTADGSKIVAKTTAGGALASLQPNDPVTFTGGGLRLVQPAKMLTSEYGPDGSFYEIAQWYADRDRLGRIIASPGARMLTPWTGGVLSTPLIPRKRGIQHLSFDVWLLLAQACAIGMVGVWLVVLRPNDGGARLFLVSCLGIALAAFSGAVADARELVANGTLLRVALSLNIIGSNIAPAGLICLFLFQPRRVATPAVCLIVVIAASLWGLIIGAGFLPMAVYYGGLLAMTGVFVAALLAQWFLSRGDPAGRAVIRWVGLTTLACTSVLTIAMVAKQLLGGSSLGGDGLSILPLFIVYGGIAFGVGRYRLFDLDRWAFRIVVGAIAAVTLLVMDAVLIFGLRIEERTALAISMLVVGYLYFPARTMIWRWVAGRPTLSDRELFQLASEVAFNPMASERRERWRGLLVRLFDPLDIDAAEEPVATVALTADGVGLSIPPAADQGSVVLRYRNQGRLLFNSQQVDLANELVSFMRKAERTRDEYARGVSEERQRIARDLHDDVSGRLLTSLRQADTRLIRDDVRAALADIRMILRGLSGELLPISQVIANMRHETFGRLDAAGIALDWPIGLAAASDPVLDYVRYRNITSAHREVVTNILRHSNASKVTVSYATEGGVLTMAVTDDGVGMDTEPCERSGSTGDTTSYFGDGGRGLANIERRLAEIGGSATMQNANPGLRVRLTAALDHGSAAS